MRELIIQTVSTTVAQDNEDPPGPQAIKDLYRINEELTSPEPVRLVVVDDMLTTGAHFKVAQSLLGERFAGVPVYGLVIARRAISEKELPGK